MNRLKGYNESGRPIDDCRCGGRFLDGEDYRDHLPCPEYLRALDHFDPVADIRAFHEKFGLAYGGPPRQLPPDLVDFRIKFMQEELDEYAYAARPEYNGPSAPALEKQLDALVDLFYVALGTAYLQGFDFAEAWRRVHEANMRKVRAARPSDSKRGSGFDVVKPPGWVAPDLSDLVGE